MIFQRLWSRRVLAGLQAEQNEMFLHRKQMEEGTRVRSELKLEPSRLCDTTLVMRTSSKRHLYSEDSTTKVPLRKEPCTRLPPPVLHQWLSGDWTHVKCRFELPSSSKFERRVSQSDGAGKGNVKNLYIETQHVSNQVSLFPTTDGSHHFPIGAQRLQGERKRSWKEIVNEEKPNPMPAQPNSSLIKLPIPLALQYRYVKLGMLEIDKGDASWPALPESRSEWLRTELRTELKRGLIQLIENWIENMCESLNLLQKQRQIGPTTHTSQKLVGGHKTHSPQYQLHRLDLGPRLRDPPKPAMGPQAGPTKPDQKIRQFKVQQLNNLQLLLQKTFPHIPGTKAWRDQDTSQHLQIYTHEVCLQDDHTEHRPLPTQSRTNWSLQ